MAIDSDVLVVGGGLAGISAALSAAREGADVRLVSHKKSTLRQASGLIDALGYIPPIGEEAGDPTAEPTAGRTGIPGEERVDPEGPLPNPYEALDRLPEGHPYRIVGTDALRDGLALFDDVVGDRYRGSHTDRNALLPTFGGTVKPTARYPLAAGAGLATDDRAMLVVGFRGLTDFDARLVANRLTAAGVPFDVAGAETRFAASFRDDARITRIAHALDKNESIDGTPARRALAEAVDPHLTEVAGGTERVGFPAFLGDDHHNEVRADIAERLGVDVFEIPMGPPSLPGLRLEDALYEALEEAGIRFETGNPVVGHELGGTNGSVGDGARIDHVLVEHKGNEVAYSADAFVLATGGLVGKGIESDRGVVREPIFGCHVPHPDTRYEWFVDDVFGAQPYARFGVSGDDRLRPLDGDDEVQFDNVHAAGATLGGADVAREKSASGVSLATGFLAGREAAKGENL